VTTDPRDYDPAFEADPDAEADDFDVPMPDDCAACADPDEPTSHNPSSFCESGERAHCTCAWCF
jgi:hypothetical protein